MEITFRVNNHIANRKNISEEKFQSLSKYLTDDATVALSVFTNKNDNDAILKIRDQKKNLVAHSKKESIEDAIDAVIGKIRIQLAKNKEIKSEFGSLIPENDMLDFENLEDVVDLNPAILNEFAIVEAENDLNLKKKSSRYKRVMDRYVNYLYALNNFDSQIKRAESHLAVLNHILSSEIDTMLHRDYVALTQSIEQIKNEILVLKNQKDGFYMNVRDEAYVNECINEELNLLKLKRR